MFGFFKKKEQSEKESQKKDNDEAESSPLSDSLEVNVEKIKEIFSDTDTLVTRRIKNIENNKLSYCIFYTDGMINSQVMNDHIVSPLQRSNIVKDSDDDIIEKIMEQVLETNEVSKTDDYEKIIQAIVYGDTVLFVDGCDNALLINSKGFSLRWPAEPENEKVLTGPREGFNEGIINNLSMVRRRIRTEDFKMKFKTFGRRTKTKACICYIDGLVNKKILAEFFRRLDKLDIDSALDVNYIIENITDSRVTPFKTIGLSERPDVVVGKLLEGRIALFLDGTPMVMTLPYLFIENFQSSEDYYTSFYYASFSRILRIVGFIITVSVPSIYVAVLAFHHELLPTPLYLSISMSRRGVPFQTILEAVGMILVFQILAETGIRMPAGIGQALSIVGALVIGQAAVEAKIVSAPMIIIVAITGITGLTVSKLNAAILVLRFTLLIFASILGLYGVMFGFMGILIHLLNLRSFGVPYVTDFVTFDTQKNKDIAVRAPWWGMITRPEFISSDKVRNKPSEDSN